jgi:hypothetical protein
MNDTKNKVVFSVRKLQEQRPQPCKAVLGSGPSEDGFCSPIHYARWDDVKNNFFCENIGKSKVTNPKLLEVQGTMKLLDLGIFFVCS